MELSSRQRIGALGRNEMVKDGDLHGKSAKEVNRMGKSEDEERWIEIYLVKLF
jgi:hypothetical protein